MSFTLYNHQPSTQVILPHQAIALFVFLSSYGLLCQFEHNPKNTNSNHYDLPEILGSLEYVCLLCREIVRVSTTIFIPTTFLRTTSHKVRQTFDNAAFLPRDQTVPRFMPSSRNPKHVMNRKVSYCPPQSSSVNRSHVSH